MHRSTPSVAMLAHAGIVVVELVLVLELVLVPTPVMT